MHATQSTHRLDALASLLRCAALRCVALRCVALRSAALRCVALRCVVLRCVALRCYSPKPQLDRWMVRDISHTRREGEVAHGRFYKPFCAALSADARAHGRWWRDEADV
jgi:hypothetical protein